MSLINTPTSFAEATKAVAADSSTKYVTGKISLVSPQQGLYVIGVSGGENPGQYVVKSTVIAGGLEAAMTGMTNGASFWGPLDSNNQFVTFAIYAS